MRYNKPARLLAACPGLLIVFTDRGIRTFRGSEVVFVPSGPDSPEGRIYFRKPPADEDCHRPPPEVRCSA